MSDCQCPEGWPQLKEREFGQRAAFIAYINRIPIPRFTVRAHRFPCELVDEATRIAVQRAVSGLGATHG